MKINLAIYALVVSLILQLDLDLSRDTNELSIHGGDFVRSLLFAVFVMSLFGCATLPKEQCENPDWERIGKIDGSRGAESTNYDEHLKTCERRASVEELESYLKGWKPTATAFTPCLPKMEFWSDLVFKSS